MARTFRIPSLLVPLVICVLFLAGCGKKSAAVKGTVVFPPNIKLAENDAGKIILVPETEGNPSASGAISSGDNSFTVNGPTGKGVALGKYKITVRLNPYPGDPASDKREELFASVNDYYDTETSKLTCEVTGDSSITIDLGKGTVTKN